MGSGRGDMTLDCKVGEERGHLGPTEITGRAVAAIADKAADPVQVGLLGADGTVLHAQRFARLLEEHG